MLAPWPIHTPAWPKAPPTWDPTWAQWFSRLVDEINFASSGNPAAAGTLTGTTLAPNVVTSSLTSVGTLVNLTVTNPIAGSVTGASGSAPAGTLTGATLAANVLASSLTSVGTLTGGATGAGFTVNLATSTISGDLAVTNLSNGTFTNVTSSATGATNNWAPGLDGNTIIQWSGASDLALTGLAGGVLGQIVALKNVGTAIATFAHNSGSSSAGNKLFNGVTSAATPVAPRGSIAYQYDGTQWQLIAHEQGAWISPAYAAGAYTATSGTWTVDAGDVGTYAYLLQGALLYVASNVATSSVSATPTQLLIAIPGGFTCARTVTVPAIFAPNGTNEVGQLNLGASGTTIALQRLGANFVVTTNTTYEYFLQAVPVT